MLKVKEEERMNWEEIFHHPLTQDTSAAIPQSVNP